MLFDFDIPKLIERSLLVNLRKARIMAFIRACCAPIGVLHGQLLVLRQSIVDQYRYNGLTHSLEALLNDTYDPINRGIYITTPGQYSILWYQTAGAQPIAYYEEPGMVTGFIYLANTDLLLATDYGYEFMINVPVLVPFDKDAMFDLVDIYRYAGRRPAIRTRDGINTTINLWLYPST